MANELEGFIVVDDEKSNCSYPNCKEKVTMSTIHKNEKKGLTFDEVNMWCEEHYNQLTNEDAKRSDNE